MPLASLSPPQGWLEKKSGGKEEKKKSKLFQKWAKRYFVLPPSTSGDTTLTYWKDEAAFRRKEAALGNVECVGATGFLKEVTKKTEIHRFTLVTQGRELKLRAGAVEYSAWVRALRPLVGEFCQKGTAGADGSDVDDDDD